MTFVQVMLIACVVGEKKIKVLMVVLVNGTSQAFPLSADQARHQADEAFHPRVTIESIIDVTKCQRIF